MDSQAPVQNKDILTKLISETQEIGIVVGEPHDLDKIAAALSLYLTLKQIGKDAQVVSVKEPIVEFSSLVGIDKLRKGFSGSTKYLTISLPYSEGEIEKVSYKIEGDKLNINLFAGEVPMSFTDKDIEYIRKGSNPSLVFAIGVSSADKLYPFLDDGSEVKIINIDNNRINDSYGDIAYVSGSFSSISEIVAMMIQDIALPVDQDIAQNIFDGISFATNNFSSSNTSPYAFEAASLALKNGAKRKNMPRETKVVDSPKRTFEEYLPKVNNVDTASNIAVENNQDMENNQETNNNQDDASGIPQDWFAPKIFRGTKKQD